MPLIMPWPGIGEASFGEEPLLEPVAIQPEKVCPEAHRLGIADPFNRGQLFTNGQPTTNFSGAGPALFDVNNDLTDDGGRQGKLAREPFLVMNRLGEVPPVDASGARLRGQSRNLHEGKRSEGARCQAR